MLIRVNAAKCIGIEAVRVTVEVDIDRGIGIHLVGMADIAVKESLLRITTALEAVGFRIPGRKIVINLAPADLRKNGSGYDLPIAIGIIAASGQVGSGTLDRYVIMGELGLDGSVRCISGALPYAELAMREGMKGIILPMDSAVSAARIRGTKVYGVRNLEEVIKILQGEDTGFLIGGTEKPAHCPCRTNDMDFSDIIGQECAKRGLEIAAAGGHNIILIGTPGSGKSSMAKAFAGILPPMSYEEALVTSKIYSIAGKTLPEDSLIYERPFRNPHHSASMAALIGGGAGENILPGEVSLANNGVLFLDEFGQMPRNVVEALRAPIEDRKVTISRLKNKMEFPSSFILVAASNPCPCGYYGEGDKCSCSPYRRASYLSRFSGPLLDRIDLQIKVSPVKPQEIMGRVKSESSESIADRVIKARNIQSKRFENENISTNAEMNSKHIEKYCPLSAECKECMDNIILRKNLSMRAFHKIIKVARSIADLEGGKDISSRHLLEAASFRMLDKTQYE